MEEPQLKALANINLEMKDIHSCPFHPTFPSLSLIPHSNPTILPLEQAANPLQDTKDPAIRPYSPP